MSEVTRLEPITTTAMEPLMDGGFRAVDVRKFAWRCNGCGNVWSRKAWAEDCESRKHRMAWVQTYYSGPVINGKPSHVRCFIRTVLRRQRERRAPSATVPPPVQVLDRRTRKTHPLPYAAYGG